MSIWVKIGLIVIVLHLLIGFGWLIYKLSPKKGEKQKTITKNTDTIDKSSKK